MIKIECNINEMQYEMLKKFSSALSIPNYLGQNYKNLNTKQYNNLVSLIDLKYIQPENPHCLITTLIRNSLVYKNTTEKYANLLISEEIVSKLRSRYRECIFTMSPEGTRQIELKEKQLIEEKNNDDNRKLNESSHNWNKISIIFNISLTIINIILISISIYLYNQSPI